MRSQVEVLTEDQVIDAVIAHLEAKGWEIESRCHANEQGEDIVALRSGQRLIVEAKGAGSSRPGSNRFGKLFNKGQVFDHVGKAVLKALRVASLQKALAGLAFPDNDDHRAEVGLVLPALGQLGVEVSGFPLLDRSG